MLNLDSEHNLAMRADYLVFYGFNLWPSTGSSQGISEIARSYFKSVRKTIMNQAT